mmetsp:Transcript_6104/g.11170  ORF Transcript_6104/g.11170 Transcript_6104/m.11170 type:complete len:119 (+) Transcript_6104:141-497(+)
MRWSLVGGILLQISCAPAKVFDSQATLGFSAVALRDVETNLADPWRKGAQRVDGNDCANVQKLGEMYYNCATYFVADDLASCRTPCSNNPDRPTQCVASEARICCPESSECARHRCCA